MSDKAYTIGSIKDHQKTGSWFVGSFMGKDLLEHDENIEISVKHLPKGWGLKGEHEQHYHSVAKEFAIVTKGRARVEFDGVIEEIGPGNYYILRQGCREQFLEILEDMELITIKTPSVADDKIITKK